MNTRALLATIVCSTVLIAASGCTTDIPARVEVKDVTTGKTFNTYETWGRTVSGVGYRFTDVASGDTVTLTNYELHTLESKKTVDANSPEAKAFKADKAKVANK